MDDVAVLRVGGEAAGVSGGRNTGEVWRALLVECCRLSQSHARDTHILPALPPLPEGAADGPASVRPRRGCHVPACA